MEKVNNHIGGREGQEERAECQQEFINGDRLEVMENPNGRAWGAG